MSNKTPQDTDNITKIIESLLHKPGALLPILHAIQDHFSYIPDHAIKPIAQALKQTPAEIYGVISFYHYFRSTPPGRHCVQVCRGEACQARGSRSLEKHVKSSLGIDYGATSSDGEFSLSPVYCLGNCARGPSLRVGDAIEGSVTNTKFDSIVHELTTYSVELR